MLTIRTQLNLTCFFYSSFLQRDDEVDVRMLIHQSLAGCVIGKGGSKIKEIRDVSTRKKLSHVFLLSSTFFHIPKILEFEKS